MSGKAEIGGKRYTIKCSVGIAWSESDDVDYAQYFDEADEQLYRAKRKENTASAARKSFKITENFEKRLVYGKMT